MQMNLRLLCLACFCSFIFSSCKEEENEPERKNPFLTETGKPSMVVAHRGGRGLYPENTLVAFDSAVILGVDVLEMDVALTKDSVLVTIHDETIDRTCDTTGKVIDYTYAELQAFNFGYNFETASGTFPYRANPVRIPRLEDIFAQHPNEFMVIEIKDGGETGKRAADKLMHFIRTYNMKEHVAAFSFSNEVMDYFHSINTDDVFTGAAINDGLSFVLGVRANPDTVLPIRVDVFAFPLDMFGIDLSSDTIIRAAHRHNAAIHYWTINDKDEMKTLIQKGADGIITDRPDLMQEALTELGY